MYILVEKELATKKKNMINNLENLWLSKYPFAIFEWMYLTEIFVVFVDYPTEKKTRERLFVLLRGQRRKHVRERTKKKKNLKSKSLHL